MPVGKFQEDKNRGMGRGMENIGLKITRKRQVRARKWHSILVAHRTVIDLAAILSLIRLSKRMPSIPSSISVAGKRQTDHAVNHLSSISVINVSAEYVVFFHTHHYCVIEPSISQATHFRIARAMMMLTILRNRAITLLLVPLVYSLDLTLLTGLAPSSTCLFTLYVAEIEFW